MTDSRLKPASKLTSDIPPLSSIDELIEFVDSRFPSAQGRFTSYFLTPEELCDIVESLDSPLRVHWTQGRSSISQSIVFVTILGAEGDDGSRKCLQFMGLFAFGSGSKALEYCREVGYTPSLWGIRDEFARHFKSTEAGAVSAGIYEEEYRNGEIEPPSLWQRICARRESLGMVSRESTSNQPSDQVKEHIEESAPAQSSSGNREQPHKAWWQFWR